jgi:hypothetical protein
MVGSLGSIPAMGNMFVLGELYQRMEKTLVKFLHCDEPRAQKVSIFMAHPFQWPL